MDEEILACLRSVAAHRGEVTVETIVIENGGNGGGVGNAIVSEFPDTRMVQLSANEGGAARNHGLRMATGRYRMFLDSDALVTPGALEALVGFMETHSEFGLVGPQLLNPDGTPQFGARRFPPRLLPLMRRPPFGRFFENGATVRHHLMQDATPTKAREVEYVIGACQVFSRAAQEAAGMLDPRIPGVGPEDTDWCIAIREAGYRIAFEPRANVIHAYRRATAGKPFSRVAVLHLYAFAYFQWKWRKQRRRLIAEGRHMDAAGQLMPDRTPATREREPYDA